MPFINYLGKNLFTIRAVGCEAVRFVPGLNEVSENSLKCLEKHPAFSIKKKDGSLVVIAEKKLSADGKKSVQEMLEAIPLILQTKLLKKIIDEDGRPAVIDAAKAQLDLISAPKTEEVGMVNGVTIS